MPIRKGALWLVSFILGSQRQVLLTSSPQRKLGLSQCIFGGYNWGYFPACMKKYVNISII